MINFGYPVVSKEDSLLVGASADTASGMNTGCAYLFILEEGEWRKKIKFTPSDKENTLLYGIAMDFNSNNFLIGAPETLVNGERTGVVYLYNNIPVNAIDIFNNTPEYFKLHQNYPNPFNSKTIITYELSNEAKVNIKLYDITGQLIKTIVDEIKHAGYHKILYDFKDLSSGIYFYSIEANAVDGSKSFRQTKKMVLLK